MTISFAFTTVSKKTIVLDVGHGGQDSGVIVNGISEKDIALSIAKKIKKLNTNPNITIVLTRNSDQPLTLNERENKINTLNPDCVISLHVNTTKNENKSGKEIFISNKNPQKEKSGNLALDLFYSFNGKNVEIKKANLALLYATNYPTALVELGYLSNKNDQKLMTSEKGQTALAHSILNAIE